MCNFFSLVVTQNGIYHDINNHSHSHIIEMFGIDDVNPDLVRIEAIPRDYSKLDEFDIKIDQDDIPSWFNLDCEHDEILKVINKYTYMEKTLSCVTQNGYLIRHMTPKQRTPDVCLAAATQSGYSIQYMTPKQRTQEICLAAVTQDGHSVRYMTPEQKGYLK